VNKSIKTVILDFDGTLGDSYNIITKTMMQTIAELKLEYRTPEECAKTIGLPLEECFTSIIPMTDEMGKKCTETYRRIFNDNNIPGAVTPFPGVIDTLKELHKMGLTITIASSRSHHSLENFVKELELQEYITYVLGADDTKKAKPDAEPVLKTLKHLGEETTNTIVVGDTKFDILMGRNAGTFTCGVTYGNGSRKELLDAGADYIIDDFRELTEYV
jgi:haloacid dehalogenase superfamily, subfamily IA, variant 3 with third motif having DD or ED/haloacid dehalogenase superfamily, subfamily IA, variant 1 with third motif having Dx(3-4)D or Dx(3-4)E